MNNKYNYVHLNCHSEYSITDGILKLKSFISKIKQLEMQSVALTDQSNLFAIVKFYKIAINLGIKPIIGSDVCFKLSNNVTNNNYCRLTLLCQNELGLNNLMQLISRSYNNWENNKPLIKLEWLFKEQLHMGLIAIAPMFDSDIGATLLQGDFSVATNLARDWVELFKDRFYVAITRIGKPEEEDLITKILQIVNNIIPIVASFEVRFLEPEDFIAHEARVCINQGVRLNAIDRKSLYTKFQYLRTPNEMYNLFADLPAALINAQEIVKRCNVKLNLGKIYLPTYKTPINFSEQAYLTKLAKEGLMQRLNYTDYNAIPKEYIDRLNTELSVINSMGFAGYFLIVADIIQWSLKNDIPVGPGRGSGAGSLVAFVLFITNINPLSYGLIFERFLNSERVSMPDFDIDFCVYGRDLVLDYVTKKYGQDSVAQIITYGTMAAKAAVRDIGRVLGCPYNFVDQLAKLIPIEIGMTITKALEQESILKNKYEEDDEVKSIIDLAIKLEGIIRNVGKHAGGLVIAPKPIINFSPLYFEKDSHNPVTQFDKKDIEDIGLVKFDFLGLKTLTIIDLAIKSINKNSNINNLNINDIPLDDAETFKLLAIGNTIAIFQLESRGMRELTMKLYPTCFEDLIAIGALYRPGPLQTGMVDDFIDRKRGKKLIQYPHQELATILGPTYGVIVYQEQVMQIAQILAGYTLGAADLLRSAMGKKKPEEMAKQRKIFIDGVCNLDQNRDPANKLGVTKAENIFNLMDKFAGYGFNKSHATAYALITYQTAWLKTHYTADFMAAVLTLDLGNTDKIIMFIVDCRKFNIKITNPNINVSEYRFVAIGRKEINYGLGGIKGVGEIAVNNILEARKKGEFRDLLDLCQRVDLHKVSRKTLEALVKAGALDCFNLHRAALLHYIEIVVKMLNKDKQNHSKQLYKQLQLNFFNEDFENNISNYKLNLEFSPDVCNKWDRQQQLLEEKQVLGFYFSDHPIKEFENQLSAIGIIKFNQAICGKKNQKFAGCIVAVRLTRTKKGDKMAFITLDDAIVRQDILIFADLYQIHRDLIKKDQLIIIEGEVSQDKYSGGIRIKCYKITNFYEALKKNINNLTVILKPLISDLKQLTEKLKEIVNKHPGHCQLILHYPKSGTLTKIKLGDNCLVDPKEQLIHDLKNLIEVEEVLY